MLSDLFTECSKNSKYDENVKVDKIDEMIQQIEKECKSPTSIDDTSENKKNSQDVISEITIELDNIKKEKHKLEAKLKNTKIPPGLQGNAAKRSHHNSIIAKKRETLKKEIGKIKVKQEDLEIELKSYTSQSEQQPKDIAKKMNPYLSDI